MKGKRWLLLTRWVNLTAGKRRQLNELFALNRRLSQALKLVSHWERPADVAASFRVGRSTFYRALGSYESCSTSLDGVGRRFRRRKLTAVGPTALFDKSFLQSLSVNEALFFDQFFVTLICPLFYIETLADLQKQRPGRTPEEEVGIIASKTPELHPAPSPLHLELCLSSLMGDEVAMDGRIVRSGGRHVKVHGKPGLVYKESPVEQAFGRWQAGEFLEVERRFASVWRKAMNALDLNAIAAGMKALGINSKTCRSLENAKALAETFVRDADHPEDRLSFALIATGMPPRMADPILERFRKARCPPLIEFSPYAAHVLTVELFFHLAIAADLIGTQDHNNRTDISYLFYLPLCMVFVSSDNLHGRTAPLFLRQNQSFVWGPELKADLRRLAERYAVLPQEQRDEGVMRFARNPPEEDGYLVSQLWDRHLRPWRGGALRPKGELTPQLIEAIQKLVNAPTIPSAEIERDIQKIEMVRVERNIHKKRGDFWQAPKDLEDVD